MEVQQIHVDENNEVVSDEVVSDDIVINVTELKRKMLKNKSKLLYAGVFVVGNLIGFAIGNALAQQPDDEFENIFPEEESDDDDSVYDIKDINDVDDTENGE